MAIWRAPDDIVKLVRDTKDECFNHLTLASVWVLVSDGKGVRDNRVLATQTRKCTTSEKLATGHDFKIIIMAETWSNLTDDQRAIAVDEALCRCGVQFLPEMVEVNGKKIPVKDDMGRVIYTDDIAYDKEGNPKWKINRPDAEAFYPLLARHKRYSEEVDNVVRVLENKPIKGPVAAERADKIGREMESIA